MKTEEAVEKVEETPAGETPTEEKMEEVNMKEPEEEEEEVQPKKEVEEVKGEAATTNTTPGIPEPEAED